MKDQEYTITNENGSYTMMIPYETDELLNKLKMVVWKITDLTQYFGDYWSSSNDSHANKYATPNDELETVKSAIKFIENTLYENYLISRKKVK